MDWCDSELDKEIRNWARWACGSIGAPSSSICSLEKNYKTPCDPKEKRGYDPIDERAAVRIERIVVGLCFRQKLIIKHYYIYKAAVNHTCRRLRITNSTWEMEMRSAHRKIAVAFSKKAKDNCQHNSTLPVSS